MTRAGKLATAITALALLWTGLAIAGAIRGGRPVLGYQVGALGGVGGPAGSSGGEQYAVARDDAPRPGASRVVAVVKSSGRQVMVIRLDAGSEGVYEVVGPLGTSRFEVSGGRVRMLESPCPEKICINTGWIGRPGEVIACVPNRVIIAVRRLP